MKARAANVDEVDEMVSGWTRGQTREAIMTALNRVDVFCGIVKELPEVMTDPHLHARGMLREIDDPRLGRITIWTSPLRMNAEAPMPQSLRACAGRRRRRVSANGTRPGRGNDRGAARPQSDLARSAPRY